MKAASGEVSLTVITIIAISLVLGFFYVMWEPIKSSITGQWNDVSNPDNTDTLKDRSNATS